MPSEKKPKKRLKPSEKFEQPVRGGSPRNPEHSSGHKGISRIDCPVHVVFGSIRDVAEWYMTTMMRK